MVIINRVLACVFAESSSSSIRLVFFQALIYFIGSTLIAWYLEWSLVDTAWSLWLTSLFVGVMAVVADTVYMFWFLEPKNHTQEQKSRPGYNPNSPGAYFSVLLSFALSMLLALLASAVAGFMLYQIVPLNETGPRLDSGLTLITVVAFKSYWTVLPISLIGPSLFYYDYVQKKKYKEDGALDELFLAQIKFAVKSFILATVAMLLVYISNFGLTYWTLFLFYFFPWTESWRWFIANGGRAN